MRISSDINRLLKVRERERVGHWGVQYKLVDLSFELIRYSSEAQRVTTAILSTVVVNVIVGDDLGAVERDAKLSRSIRDRDMSPLIHVAREVSDFSIRDGSF